MSDKILTVLIVVLGILALALVTWVAFTADNPSQAEAQQECLRHPGKVVFIKDLDGYICQH